MKGEYKQDEGHEMYTRWCTKGGRSESMHGVWKEGGFKLNPLRNMWLLGIWAMFRSARKFGESGTGFYVQSV